MLVTWTIIVVCWALACVALYGVRRLDNPPGAAIVCALLGSAGAIGLTALPIAAAGGVDAPGVVGAGLLLSAIAAPLCWLLLTKPRGWTPPDHGHPTRAAETVAAQQPTAAPDLSRYRAVSAAEAIARAQGAGAYPAASRSARVRRIMDMEVSQ